MWPVLGGLLTGGGSLLGSIFSSQQSGENTQAQIAASEQQQATQNAFTEQMSNTAYQRASADMKAAGLNPMMMFGSGAAASTPSGSSIQAPMPQTTSPLGNLGQTMSAAINSANAVQELDNKAADAALKKQQTKTEENETLDAANRAAKSGLSLPKSRREAQEEAYIQELPEQERKSAAQSPYAGKGFGHYGEQIYAPIRSSITGLGSVVDRMVNSITGPTGKALWDKAYDAAKRAPGDVQQGAHDMYEDFRKIRGTTLNNDWR